MLFQKISNGPEYWKLREILLYKPSNEIDIVNNENYKNYLFREPIDSSLLRKQYNMYLEQLKELDVEPILINDLMEKINWHPGTVPPNMFFMRDVIGVLENKILISNMKHEIRRYEGFIVKKILESLGWEGVYTFSGSDYFEGGDLLYLNEDTVMIGYGPRTSFSAAYKIGRIVNELGKNSILVSLSPSRVHLDGTMMPIDEDIVVAHIPSIRFYPSFIMYKNGDYDIIDMYKFLIDLGYEVVAVNDHEANAFGSNLMVIHKGLIISYSWNKNIIKKLEKHGVEVIIFMGSEFMKAGGGLHCVFNTILREK